MATIALATPAVRVSAGEPAGSPPAPAAATTPRSTPPPTPVPPNGSPSPFPTTLSTPHDRTRPPRVGAQLGTLQDLESGQVLWARHEDQRHPIASLTKLMTANLALRAIAPSALVKVSARAAAAGGSSLGVRPGERVQARDLVYGLLLQSSNDAALALAEAVSGSVGAFVQLMNRRAGALGLHHTRFFSPDGLDDRGYSTPTDLAALTRHAYGLPLFAEIVRTKFHDIPAPSGPDRRVQNRNVLLWLYPGAVGVKTGYTSKAGYCLVAVAHRGTRSLVAVALGDATEQAAFDDAAALLNFGFGGFARRRLVSAGEPLGTVTVQGTPVPIAAGQDLILLIRKAPSPTVARSMEPMNGLSLPLTAGQPVGRLVVSGDGHPLGSVPVAAAESVASPPPTRLPTTERGPPVLLRLLVAALRVLLRPFL